MGASSSNPSKSPFDDPGLFWTCVEVSTAPPVPVPRGLPTLNRIAAGADHCIAVFGTEAVQLRWASAAVEPGGPGVLVAHRLKPPIAMKVAMVACGARHSLVLADDGRCWGCGASDRGQLGQVTGPMPSYRLALVLEGLKECAAGGHVSCFVTMRREVVCVGDKDALMRSEDAREPVDAGANGTAEHAVHGGRAGAMLSRLGTLYTWGRNVDGALGTGEEVDSPKPRHILDKVTMVSAGPQHMLACNVDGSVFLWGRFPQGAHHAPTDVVVPVPTKVPGFPRERVVAVACGGRHSLALTDQGRLYGWGHNTRSQLGHRPPEHVLTPMLLSWAQRMPVRAIAAGHTQSVVIDDRERLWATGAAGGNRAVGGKPAGEEPPAAGPHPVDLHQALTLAEALG